MIPLLIGAGLAAASLSGSVGAAMAQRAAAKSAKRIGQYYEKLSIREQQALDAQALAEQAASQRSAAELDLAGKQAMGRVRARMAASGATMASPSIVQALSDLAGAVDYRRQAELWSGAEKAKALRYQGQIARAGGEARKSMQALQSAQLMDASRLTLANAPFGAAAAGAGGYAIARPMFGTVAPMFDKYGGGGQA